MIQEFKDFALKGNVVDMAVGIVIGGAFGKIVSSLVGDVIMPAVGQLTGGVDFSSMKYTLQAAATDAAGKVTAPEVSIKYGLFLNTIIDFVIVALAIFLVVKQMNRFRKPAPAAGPPPLTKDQELLGEIRDLLKK
jgi:large conductance mechanosensitive channel